jgi:hypothetical protein
LDGRNLPPLELIKAELNLAVQGHRGGSFFSNIEFGHEPRQYGKVAPMTLEKLPKFFEPASEIWPAVRRHGISLREGVIILRTIDESHPRQEAKRLFKDPKYAQDKRNSSSHP